MEPGPSLSSPTAPRAAAPLRRGEPLKIATRDAYGKALARLGQTMPRIVVFDADLSGSTKTALFAKRFPDRFFNMGVAEANMIGHAAGAALMGKIPFASSFAMFATGKAWEQVRQTVAVPNLNVKIVASHAGLTVGEDGTSHQMLEDLALMRVLPPMTVVVPADAVATEKAIEAVARRVGPCYVRTSRTSTAVLYEDAVPFEIGRALILRDGTDLTIAACGVEVWHAWKAAEVLAAEGIEARVLDLHTVKPIDEAAIAAAAEETGAILTVEEHQIQGGFGSAVAEVVVRTRPVPMRLLGVDGRFGQSGKAEELLEKYGLTAPHVAAAARALLRRKKGGG
ncbi:MAG TPA: transketolase C-terminal domain-containing protein [Planctomycetota bacterium]|jgi:transketolase|nr:transketolase C-terminal domain-containing protein [Planctomycetota bacterium]